jgi:3-oxoadipate enol-lactonase
MAIAIAMPKLGMTMEEGAVIEWPYPLGARVEKGDVVLIIESEKAEVEIQATAAGVFRHVYVDPGETVACGTLLAVMTPTAEDDFDAAAFRAAYAPPAADKPLARRPASASTAPRRAQAPRRGPVPVTPAARVRARDFGLDPTTVSGSGPGGRVTRADIEEWAERRAGLITVAEGVALDVPEQGAGDTVLLLPGFGCDVSALAPQTACLAERFRVRGVNPRGVAASTAVDEERYDIVRAAADAATLATDPVHAIGASMGAAVALELALAHPERVRSLTLITPFVTAGARLDVVCESWCELARQVTPPVLAHALLPWFFSPAFLADAATRARVGRALATTLGRVPAATLTRAAAGIRAWSGSRIGDLRGIRVPTLVIAAGGDLLTPDAAAIAAAIPSSTLVTIPVAGHAVAIEAAQPVNAALLEHLNKA